MAIRGLTTAGESKAEPVDTKAERNNSNAEDQAA